MGRRQRLSHILQDSPHTKDPAQSVNSVQILQHKNFPKAAARLLLSRLPLPEAGRDAQVVM